MQTVLFSLFAAGMISIGLFATRTDALMAWPGYALVALAGIIALVRGRARLSSAPSDFCLVASFVTGLYLVVRAYFSPVVYIATMDLVLVLFSFLVYVLSVGVLSDQKWRKLFFWLLLGLGLVNVYMVGRQVIFEDWGAHLLPYYVRTYGPGRAGGLFNNPNHLASFLLPCIFFCLSIALLGRGGA